MDARLTELLSPLSDERKRALLGVRPAQAAELLDSEGVRLLLRYLAIRAREAKDAAMSANVVTLEGAGSYTRLQSEHRVLMRVATNGAEDLLNLIDKLYEES